MKLKIVLPTKTLVEAKIDSLVAEGGEGSFGILPHHIDYTSALVPGILSYEESSGQQWYVAHDEGVLVKQGAEVSIVTRTAIKSRDLKQLRSQYDRQLRDLDDRERKARSVLAMLEGGIIKQINEQVGEFE